jgi:hypothetical protein
MTNPFTNSMSSSNGCVIYNISGTDYWYCTDFTGAAKFAQLNPAGGLVGGWTATSGVTNNCTASNLVLLCVGSSLAEYAMLSTSGASALTSTTNYPQARTGQMCLTLGVGPYYAFCIDSDGATMHIYEAKYTNHGIIGGWTAQPNFPVVAVSANTPCTVDSPNQIIYCMQADDTTGYYSKGAGLGSFTCSIRNMDAGNYLLPNGKVYDFRCSVQSNAISGGCACAIEDMRMQFNDTVHIITLEYSNSTAENGFIGFKILNGASYVGLATGSVINSISGTVRNMTVDFKISLGTSILDASNRGIQLYADLGTLYPRGYEYVQISYFNILNQGGGVSQTKSGACSVPKGSDVYGTTCKYGANTHNWIATNTTWANLQHYQTQFSLFFSDGNTQTKFSDFMQGDSFLMQDHTHNGGNAENSTNAGNWIVKVGLYHYDNSTWVKGLNVVLRMLKGDQGTNDEWTTDNAVWYNGNTLVRNDTINCWIGQAPKASLDLWVDLWYSNNNASTSQGGRVGCYWTAMHNSGFLWWSSWSPQLQNQTSSLLMAPILDHNGKTQTAGAGGQFSKIGWNMSRPVAGIYLKQPNFNITSYAFQTENFLKTNPPMLGIPVPSFTAAAVPILQSNSFFGPIITAIQYIAKLIIDGLTSLGNFIWAGLGARFPWFTAFWGSAGALVVNLWTDLAQIIGYLIAFLGLISSFFGPVVTIINVIGAAWGTIQGIYLPIFSGANLSAMITLAVLWIFGGWVLENAETGNSGAFFKGATVAWRITSTFLFYTLWFAKLIIDTVEGLIP